MTRLMTRIYSAIENGEHIVLDQVIDDIDSTKNGKPVDSDEYKMIAQPDGSVIIEDKGTNEITRAVDSDSGVKLIDDLKKDNMESQVTKKFSKSRARKFLVNSNGDIMAMGWESSSGQLLKDHPDWKMISNYDLNAYLNGIEKRFSNFSEENQKLFTKPYRRYVVVDGAGKFQYLVDITNAKGLVEKNPGWSMIKEVEWNKMQQPQQM